MKNQIRMRAAGSQWRVAASGIALVALCSQLEGCFPLFVAGAAATTYSITDRRSIGAQGDDKVIAVKVDSRISELIGSNSHIGVTSFNRKVLLTGEVPDEKTKARAGEIANNAENVTAVDNELALAPNASLATQSNDALITTAVKTQLVNSSDILANAFKVVTERGIVYLMGRVTRHEGDRAGEVVSTVRGVGGVVKVFDYITDDELKDLQSHPADNSGPKGAT